MLFTPIRKQLACMLFLLTVSCTVAVNRDRVNDEDTEGASKYTETKIVPVWDNSRIDYAVFNEVDNVLLLISEQIKEIVKLEMESESIATRYTVNNAQFKVLGIADNGGEALVATEIDRRVINDMSFEYINKIAIIDTNDGTTLECLSITCNDDSTAQYEAIDTGGTISFDGEIVVVYSSAAYTVDSWKDKSRFEIVSVNNPDEEYWWQIGKIAIDQENRRVAIIFEEGRVMLRGIMSSFADSFLNFSSVISSGSKNDRLPIKDAVFDRSGNWLAFVRGESISIWRVFGVSREIASLEIGRISKIKFDARGDFLYVCSVDKVIIFKLSDGSKSELYTPGITTFDVSSDNRVLYWGDTEGNLHVWDAIE